MPKGHHYSRPIKRNYTSDYPRIHASAFVDLLKQMSGSFVLRSTVLDTEHKHFDLNMHGQARYATFEIQGQKVSIGLRTDNRSASKKLYLVCPHCLQQRQHLYALSHTYSCRICANLQYRCQSERPIERLARKIRKARQQIWQNHKHINNLTISLAIFSKPKGLHHDTYEKRLERLFHMEQRYWHLSLENMTNTKVENATS